MSDEHSEGDSSRTKKKKKIPIDVASIKEKRRKIAFECRVQGGEACVCGVCMACRVIMAEKSCS